MEKKKSNFWGNLLYGFTTGVTIGVFVSLFVNVMLKTDYYSPATPKLVESLGSNLSTLVNFLLYGVIGIVSVFSTSIFNIESLSLLTKTILHFLVVQLGVFLVSLVLGWVESYFIFVLPISIVIYITIWLVIFLQQKKDIKSLNDGLKEKKQK
ncbi:MAG: DUF3021 domain-containing protein [Sphaerochaetaceae bacterium]